jgi:hypothetical protein
MDGSQIGVDIVVKAKIFVPVRNQTLVIQPTVSHYTVGYPQSHHAYCREEFHFNQPIPERKVSVPCSQEVLSSKMSATVSRHAEDFSAEENSTKVQHISLETSVESGTYTCNRQILLK